MKKKVLSVLLAAIMLFTFCSTAFAANTKSITWVASLDKESVTNDVDQTVTLTIAPSSSVTLDAFDYVVNYNGSPITIDSVSCTDSRIAFSSGDLNLKYSATQGKVLFGGAEDAENLADVASIGTVVFTVPAGTPVGTYSFSVSDINASEDYGTPWASKEESNTVTLTVTTPTAASGYSAAVPKTQSVPMGETNALTINLSSGDAETYNAYYFELAYDTDKLQYVSATEGATVDSSTAGKLIVTGYGAERAITAPITVNFKSIAIGDTEITLAKANVDKAANAVVQDTAAATITNATAKIQIGGYGVALPTGVSGESAAEPGQDYTFSVSDVHYNYSFAATMGGEAANVIDNGDGSFTVKNVSGALSITLVEKTEKTYNVTLNGDGTLTDGNSATYLTDYHFARGSDSGYTYSVSVTIGGEAFTDYTANGVNYTIPGASVIGDIVITITKQIIPQESYAVTVEGNGAGDASVTSATVVKGGTAELTLVPVENYEYSVTATMGGNAAQVVVNGNKYTVSSLTGNVVFTVTKAPISDTVISVSKYLELDEGYAMWLVKATGTLGVGKVYSYDNTPMYYSEKDDAYYWLVISGDTQEEVYAAAEAAVKEAAATAITIDYSGDVNGTKLVDVNDAQLVWNMYNVHYQTFEECSMFKFLNADVNGDTVIDTRDAVAVINIVLNGGEE